MLRKKRVMLNENKTIAVDVDKTLIGRHGVNNELVKWIKKKSTEGFFIIVWSSRGKEHSENAVDMCGLNDFVDCIISKPGFIIDDQGWNWIKYTTIIKRRQDFLNNK